MSSEGGILSVKVERGPCEGTCPIYRVVLRRDGTATWFGERFVDPVGERAGTFDPAKVVRLQDFIVASGFFTWDRRYDPLGTCGAFQQITVRTSEGTWAVEQDGTNPEPRRFMSIVRRVDRIAAAMGWRTDGAAFR